MSYSPSCCSTASAQLKLYQAFIFSIPIFFTLILLFLFYLFYLRRRRGADWSNMQTRVPLQHNPRLSESGLNKEFREMLPIIVFSETFSIKDTQCSVCLGDYQAEDRLQRIPICGHTFHMDCIDHWLSTHATCPLCRLSLIPAGRSDNQEEAHSSGTEANIGPSDDTDENGRFSERLMEEDRGGCSISDRDVCDGGSGHGGHEAVTVLDVAAGHNSEPVITGPPQHLV